MLIDIRRSIQLIFLLFYNLVTFKRLYFPIFWNSFMCFNLYLLFFHQYQYHLSHYPLILPFCHYHCFPPMQIWCFTPQILKAQHREGIVYTSRHFALIAVAVLSPRFTILSSNNFYKFLNSLSSVFEGNTAVWSLYQRFDGFLFIAGWILWHSHYSRLMFLYLVLSIFF